MRFPPEPPNAGDKFFVIYAIVALFATVICCAITLPFIQQYMAGQ